MIYDVSNDKKNTVLGKNRAEINDNVSLRLYEEYVSSRDNKGICVFISHKSEDKEDAKAVSIYLFCEVFSTYPKKVRARL